MSKKSSRKIGTRHYLDASLSKPGLVIPNHLLQSHLDGPPRLPLQLLLGTSGVRPPLLGIIDWDGLVDYFDLGVLQTIFLLNPLHDIPHVGSEIADGEFISVAQIYGARLGRVHKGNKTVDEIMDILKRPGLCSVAVDSHILTTEGLHNEIRHYTTISGIHYKRLVSSGGAGGIVKAYSGDLEPNETAIRRYVKKGW